MRDRDEGLGRVYRSIPEDGYDVDWVLGGRLFNVPRWELRFTTAEAEGLMDAPRRKRKPNVRRLTPPENFPKKAKLAVSEKKNKKKSTAKRSPTKERPLKKSSKTARADPKVKSISAKKANSVDTSDTDSETARPSHALDMYKRHRKEFERSLIRLEKVDTFGFFLGDPLPGFDEFYNEENKEDNTNKATSTVSGKSESTERVDPLIGTSVKGDRPENCQKPVLFPSQPPFNWTVVRKRMDHGRYVLDRIKMEEDHRKNCHALVPVDKYKNTAARHNLKYSKGVHWNQFRKDVLGMCDAAISRDPSGTSGGTGTLGHTAKKIKDVSMILT